MPTDAQIHNIVGRVQYRPEGLHLNSSTNALPFSAPPPSIPVFTAALLEPLLAVATFLTAHFAHGRVLDRAAMLLSIMVMLLVFPGTNRFYENRLNALVDIVVAWATVLAILLLCGFATKSFRFFDTSVLIWWAAATPVAQTISVLIGGALMRRHARHPDARRPALVIGAGTLGARVARILQGRRAYGHDFVGHLEDRDLARCAPETSEHIVGKIGDALDCIQRHNVKDVYITLPLSSQPRIDQLIANLHDSAVSIYFVPDVAGVSVIQGRMRNMDGVPVVSLLESPFVGINGLAKRVSDIVLASAILMLISPILLAVAIGVKLTSPGPVIFKQCRNGVDGKEITVYKFRSMSAMDNGAVVKQATRGDARVTPFGAFIRRTSLDELPQFINVLQGRMSIVGPRPHAVAHNEQYRELVQSYMLRHKVKPGITGWAQINGYRGETDTLDKMIGRVQYDIDYLRNWSLTMDMRIIAKTIKLTFWDKNAY
jgi:putative colanic acid biosynthesis UDP-glucose lipid carrier transferase